MKKFILLLIILFSLTSCMQKSNNEENHEISTSDLIISVPSGAPSLAFYNEIENKNFKTGDVKAIMPELLGSGKPDVIVIDTVNGIKALNEGANYYLAANITFGNFFIAATGVDDDNIMDEEDYIVLFSQGATPDLLFHYLYGDKYDKNIHYVNAVSDAATCLSGINIYDDEKKDLEELFVEYVLIAQPILFATMKQNENISIYENIQEVYKNKSNLDLIQASVFISKNLDHDIAEAYLNNLENNINALLAKPELFIEKTKNMSDEEIKDIFGIPNSNIASAVIKQNNLIGLGYKKAVDNKEAIDAFIALFGVNKTSEEIYFK